MLKYIDADELYPFWTLDNTSYFPNKNVKVDISTEFLEKYQQVMTDFFELQEELEKLNNENLR